jgi:hypothetical protein
VDVETAGEEDRLGLAILPVSDRGVYSLQDPDKELDAL